MQNRLGILLPITSKGCDDVESLLNNLRGLGRSLRLNEDDDPWVGKHVCIAFGIDEGDVRLWERKDDLRRAFQGLDVSITCFKEEELSGLPAGPVCWMWGRLAHVACNDQRATHLLLLGDDTRVEPQGWPHLVFEQLAVSATTGSPARCLVLLDAADPGYPSFAVIDADHLRVFGTLLPDIFVNQVGDPFLSELYRRVGSWSMLPTVTVHNACGGIQLPDDDSYAPPRYPRVYPPIERVLKALEEWTAVGRAAYGPGATTVDVLVPAGRSRPEDIRKIVEACSSSSSNDSPSASNGTPLYDVRFGVVSDDPAIKQPNRASLEALRDGMLGRMRLRFNAVNQGASLTRNRALDESLAELIILLDDDVVPQPGLVAAYARAFRQHPEAAGFAGPTYLPKSGSVWAHAVHMSDVAFFWEAPATCHHTMPWVPWAVTANMAVRNTSVRFDARFPRTGGGEDIDFCFRACPGKLLAVPEAAAHHPLWNGGRPNILRFGRWAYGDAQLLYMYRRLLYGSAPNAVELAALALCCAAAATACMAVAQAAACMCWLLGRSLASLPALGEASSAAAAAAAGATATASSGGSSGMAAFAAAAAGASIHGVVVAWLLAQVAVWLAVFGSAVLITDLALELWRHCANRRRLARYPCSTWRLRIGAALLAAAIKVVSEAGRLLYHVRHAWHTASAEPLRKACVRFDWFGGMDVRIVRMEQARAAVKLAVYAASCWLVWAQWHAWCGPVAVAMVVPVVAAFGCALLLLAVTD